MSTPRTKDLARITLPTPPPNPWQSFPARGLPLWPPGSLKPIVVKTGSRDYVSCVGWSCDGRRMASCGYERAVRVWSPERTTDLHLTTTLSGGHEAPVQHLSWHPSDPFTLVSLSKADKTLAFWDVRQPTKPTATLKCPKDFLSVEWHPSGRSLLALSADDGLYEILSSPSPSSSSSDPSSDPAPAALEPPADPEKAEPVSPAQTQWHVGPRNDHHGQLNSFLHSHTGSHLLLPKVSGTLEILRLPSFASVLKIPAHVGSCYNVALDPRGWYAATCGGDGVVVLWDTGEWVGRRVFDADMPIRELAFSHSGEYIATTSDDTPTIDIYETETGLRSVRIPTPGPAATVAWHPSKHILVAGGDGGASARQGWVCFFGL